MVDARLNVTKHHSNIVECWRKCLIESRTFIQQKVLVKQHVTWYANRSSNILEPKKCCTTFRYGLILPQSRCMMIGTYSCLLKAIK